MTAHVRPPAVPAGVGSAAQPPAGGPGGTGPGPARADQTAPEQAAPDGTGSDRIRLAGARRRFYGVILVSGVGFGLTSPFTSLFALQLGANDVIAGFIVSSIAISLLLVDFFGTQYVPRLDPRRSIALSIAVFGAGSFVSAAAPSWVIVLTARVGQGFGTALFLGSALQLAVRLADPGRAGETIGAFNAVWFVGVSSGPLVGGAIASSLGGGTPGLRLLFAVCGAANLVGATVAWIYLPRLGRIGVPQFGLPRAVGVRGARGAGVLWLAGLGQAIRAGLALTLIPLLGGRELGMDTFMLGAALFALAVTDILAMTGSGRWADRVGRRRPLALALAWGVVATLFLASAQSHAVFVVGCLAVGITIGTIWVLPATMTVDIAQDPEAALASYRFCSDLGMLAGGLLAGAGIGLAGERGAMVGAAGLLVLGLLITIAVGETAHRRTRADAADPIGSDDLPAPAGPVATPPLASALLPVCAPVPLMRPAPDQLWPATSAHLTTVPAAAAAHPPTTAHRPATRTQEIIVLLPSLDDFAVIAASQGISLRPERLTQAHAAQAAMWPGLERLRALPVPFLGTVPEPATALRWIESGGRSA
ncbi:MFS transporter [Pseudofrankia sp. BMG5.36]|uniref:MFS transporter n=1 Tax=Pseudofrankia sp. BMG5.36 TaxID=1834512 RepID=UPI0008D9E048|nr:MFS transporter [Pseudofrankia sp. BMG5.36]OHV48880.1 hypothetical protein BCD48_13510 [Pseudofrankia sp. BMG5.36]